MAVLSSLSALTAAAVGKAGVAAAAGAVVVGGELAVANDHTPDVEVPANGAAGLSGGRG